MSVITSDDMENPTDPLGNVREPLDGARNFKTWATDTSNFNMSIGRHDILTDKYPKPVPPKVLAENPAAKEIVDNWREDVKQWQIDNDLIIQGIWYWSTPKVQKHIMGLADNKKKNAAQLWIQLSAWYADRSPARIHRYAQQLDEVKLSKFPNMRTYVNAIIKLMGEHEKDMGGDQLPGTFYAFRFLSGLGGGYNVWSSNITAEHSMRRLLTHGVLKHDCLLVKEARLEEAAQWKMMTRLDELRKNGDGKRTPSEAAFESAEKKRRLIEEAVEEEPITLLPD